MFVDKVRITVAGGRGGDGAVAFHREKYVASGGPDGGDGGHGGSVILRVNDNLSTLLDFRYKRKYQAGAGVSGMGRKMAGKRGENLIIEVPRGTVVRDSETEAIIADMSTGEDFVIAKGTAELTANAAVKLIRAARRPAIKALEKRRRFEAPVPIEAVAEMTKPFLSLGNQYGEGWFLTGEMVELLTGGVPNIICIQPFACLPNHVVGKGVIKALRRAYPQANISAVDYDPGASEVNQLNRIKLMLSVAQKNLAEETKESL